MHRVGGGGVPESRKPPPDPALGSLVYIWKYEAAEFCLEVIRPIIVTRV